jgi:hypothetical protein
VDVTTSCDIRVFAVPVTGLGAVLYHTYVEDIIQISINGQVAITVYQIFQAQPQTKSVPHVQCKQSDARWPGRCWLNEVASIPVISYAGNTAPPPTPGTEIWDSFPSPSECYNVDLSQFTATIYPNNTNGYNGVFQNSNSWVYTFLLLSGVPMPEAGAIGLNALGRGIVLVGWGIFVPW